MYLLWGETPGTIKGLQLCRVMCKGARRPSLASSLLKINTHLCFKHSFIWTLLLDVAADTWLLLDLHEQQ